LRQKITNTADDTPVIVRAAQEEEVPLCVASLELFIDILAHEASNLTLKVLATGGVYLGGGIPPRILSQLRTSNFKQAFTSKGRFRRLLEHVPVHVICHGNAALLGAARDGLETIVG
jgi:glucokinase